MKSAFTLALLASAPCVPRAQVLDADPVANPARPTVATPATLTPVGYLQFENGVLAGWHSPEFSSRIGVNQVTKLAVDPRLQLLLLSEPETHSSGAALNGDRPGEVFAGAQGVVLTGTERRPTIAVSYIGRLHSSPAPEYDLGTFRQSATVLLSADTFGFHSDWNAMVLEQTEDCVRRAQYGQTLAVSHPVGPVVVSTELWHFTQPFTKSNAIGSLWAVAYAPRKNLVMDVGFNRGLTTTSTLWETFVGLTYLLPKRLFPGRHIHQ